MGAKLRKSNFLTCYKPTVVVIGGILRDHPNRDQRAKEVCHRYLSEEEGGSGLRIIECPTLAPGCNRTPSDITRWNPLSA